MVEEWPPPQELWESPPLVLEGGRRNQPTVLREAEAPLLADDPRLHGFPPKANQASDGINKYYSQSQSRFQRKLKGNCPSVTPAEHK